MFRHADVSREIICYGQGCKNQLSVLLYVLSRLPLLLLLPYVFFFFIFAFDFPISLCLPDSLSLLLFVSLFFVVSVRKLFSAVSVVVG